MKNLDYYRTTLCLLAAGLLSCASARAQTTANTPTTTANENATAAAGSLIDRESALLRLNQPPPPETTVAFYDNSHKDLHQSLAWMLETNALTPTYWNLYTEARIRLQLQDYAGARTTAEQAYKLALKAMPASQQYVALSAAVVAKAQELASR